MFRDGRLPDPRTMRGLIIYTVLGVAAEVCSFVHQITRHILANHNEPCPMPQPVIFDYGTGMRIQQMQPPTSTMILTEADLSVAPTAEVAREVPFQ